MSAFNFKISVSKEEKKKRRIIYTLSAAMLISLFIYGFVSVYVNCYNIMNSEPMTVLEFYSTNEIIGVTVLNHDYILLHLN